MKPASPPPGRPPSPSAAEACDLQIRSVDLMRPLKWLDQGARDLRRCPVPGLLHGAAAAAFGLALLSLASQRFWLLAGALSGFLIVAPLVATALYEVSRRLESGQPPPSWRAIVAVWRPRDHRLVVFGILLALAGTGWVMTSASLITAFAPQAVNNPMDFVRHVVLREDVPLFEIWLALGGVMAAPVFASSVVALPMLLDRPCGVLTAVLASWRVVMANPGAMALWAAILMFWSLVGMLTAMLGLVIVVPWLAHASWHAYRDLVTAGSPASTAQASHGSAAGEHR
jgi:uncharacterized membrane protein